MSLDDRVNDACHRIEDLYNETDGHCYVSFSGGKDSTVLLALIKLCEEVYTIPQGGIPAVFSNTGIELGVTVDFVKWVRDSGWYSNVVVIHPEKPFSWVIQNEGKPMKSKLRSKLLNQYHTKPTDACRSLLIKGTTLQGHPANKSKLADKDMHMIHPLFSIRASWACCTYMKKRPFLVYEEQTGATGTITGLRMAEGGVRELSAKNRIASNHKLCTYTKHGTTYKMPIIDWSDEDMEQFVSRYSVPLSKAYTEHKFDRTGCMACPYSKRLSHDLEYLFYHEPNRYKASMHWLKDVYIAQNVVLPFDEAYERERENVFGGL